MNESDLRRWVDDLADRVPDRRPPVEELLRDGPVAVRRRRTRRGAAAALVVGAALVAGFAVASPLGPDGTDRGTDPVSAVDGESTPSQDPTRQVALGRVAVTVPGSWSSDQPEGCLDAPQGGVAVSDLRVDCSTPDDVPPSIVVLAPTRALIGPSEDLALTPVDHDGLEVLVQPAPRCSPGGSDSCSTRVLLPTEGLAVLVEVDASAPGRIDDIVDSISLLPDDRFAVPPDLVGARLDPALDALTRIGARVASVTTGGPRIVTSVDPTPGTVLAAGSSVVLDYGSSGQAPPDVDLQGSWTLTTTSTATPAGQVSAQVVFTDETVRIGRCGPWTGSYVADRDEIRFDDLQDEGPDRDRPNPGCVDQAAAVAGLLEQVEHVTRAGSRVYLHRASYEIVATLRR